MIINFAKRSFKEIVRDPLIIIFSILLPLFLLIIFQQFKIPNEIYSIVNFTPGIIIFSLSFITMFTATLVSKDRNTALLTRLCVSPMKSYQYILGYIFSLMPMVIIQNIIFFGVAAFLGLNLSLNIFYTILLTIIISPLFILLGILIGSITSEKAASGASSIVVQLVAFTSGMYFSVDMVGNAFKKICEILPFKNILDLIRFSLNNSSISFYTLINIIVWFMVITFLTVIVFKNKMISEK